MAKIEKGDMKFKLIYLQTENKITKEIVVKEGVSKAEAEAEQASIIKKNKAKFEELQNTYRETDEGIDSPEKRGRLKAIQNELKALMYPSKDSSFAIARDHDLERKIAAKNRADQRSGKAES